ncbi:hypothetical protein A2856_04070 [Candidatus Uhrbacteria bacterium RIFCSPHIGHO2_01_FULL_63_20]|uniref:Peptidase M50 domain-containing protein n=1 Tax=Candidatus Uhrbacteria bacterium RIFCSPHIGHO2_01_FULL_63_20 TaxID=1802385 RepID=A0A1F7TNM2_9BACT|nr:MAG: hypothetical protein A2856_04070 [Candidatus Uhrbacteria bacterium RIFCSPHIGHO2_01_FULL_63_20]
MFFNLILASPMMAIAWVAAIMLSLTVHEFSHALVGKWRGDRTAEHEGRLTLNPLAHVDPLGFLSLLLVGFGWAKPVPYNPYNLRNPAWDGVAIALAGPFSNLLLASMSAFALRFLVGSQIITQLNLLVVFLFFLILLNLGLAFFNFIPVHPLDGSKLFFALTDHPKYARLRFAVAHYGPQLLMALVVISLVTPFNVFFFVSAPTYAACDFLLSDHCQGFLGAVLGAI